MVSKLFNLLSHYLLPKKLLTTVAGYFAENNKPIIKNNLIEAFIKKFNVNMQEAIEENPANYENFNDFFTRKLKPDARQISSSPIVSPVDGIVSEFGIIIKNQLIQAKGIEYSVEELLQTNPLKAKEFENGCFITLYLSPKDYHRVHMPLDGTLTEMSYIPGQLFSVSPLLQQNLKGLFARNERISAFFNTEYGKMALVMVGATVVGGMSTAWHGKINRNSQKARFLYPSIKNEKVFYQKGEEIGYFSVGSTVILLFADSQKICWNTHLKRGQTINLGENLIKTSNI